MHENFINVWRRSARNPFSPSHDSEAHYSRLQKHIQSNQFLRAYLVQNAAMTGLQRDRIQALQTPPHCPPPITLLQFQNQFQQPDHFPDDIFPQLRSIKREIWRNKRMLQQECLREMEPLSWATGTRSNRPFETITVQPSYTNENVHAFVPRRPRLEPRVEPTEYFLEQLNLSRDPTGPDPYAHHLPTDAPRGVFLLVTSFIKRLLDSAGILVNFLLNSLFLTVFWGLVWPVKILSRLATTTEWEMMLAVLLAAQFAKMLPGMEGLSGMGEIRRGTEEPVYTMMIPGKRVIGTGSTFQNAV